MPLEAPVDERRARRVVFTRTARRAIRSGAIMGLVFAWGVVFIVSSYGAAYPTARSRAILASSLSGNVGLAALYGKARALDTVAGFAAWRTGGLPWVGAIWALFLGTRLLRGEEDAGRWEMFLSGRTTRMGAAAQAVAGLGVGVATLWALTAVATVGIGSTEDVGFPTTASLYFATSLVALPAVFVAVGVLVGQLAPTRRQANLIAGVVLGASFLIRMVADAGVGLDWLRWATPLGWVEELRPLTGSRPLALAPIVALIGVLVAVSLRLAGRRDLGGSTLPNRDTAPARTGLLGGQLGLTLRLTRWVGLVWAVGLAIFGALMGIVAVSASKVVSGSAAVEEAIGRLGGVRGGSAAFLGLVFAVVVAMVAVAAAGQVSSIRNEEAEGHLDHLLARPVARGRWLGGRLVVSAAMVIVASAVVGLAAWAGAATQGSGIGIGELLLAGLNVAPAALFVLGVGGLVYGLRPRLATGLAYGVVVWSFVIALVASLVETNRWLVDSSLFTHVAPAPAADPDWLAAAGLAGIGLLAAAAAIAAFHPRDVISA